MSDTQRELNSKLRVGQPLHTKIADAIGSRLRLSEQRMRGRYKQIAENEELFQAYIPEQDVDALRRQNRQVNGVPEYRTIEIPYSYAVAMTAHTYYTSVFLSRSPVLQLSGRHGEGETNKVAIESLLAYQMTVGEMLMPLFIWLLDPAKAGYGVIGHYWDKEVIRTRTFVSKPATFLGMPIPGAKPIQTEQVEDVPGYEGNRTYNIRPQDFFPDPRVALVHFQKGEFAGRYVETPWNEIFEGQKTGRFFNYEVLKKMRADGVGTMTSGMPGRDTGSASVTHLPGELNSESGYDVPVGFVKGHEFAMKLIPSEWGLGSGGRQEVWMFNRASNGVVFGAMPLGEYHGKFPYDILVDEIDGYSVFPRSMLERVKPMNDVITWLVNTHFYNVRQTLNNQFVVDPSMVVMKDVENPEPGKIIRLKPEMYGKDVRTAIHQLVVGDATSGHIGDVGVFQGFVERVTGVNDSIMGMMAGKNNRKTATEVRTSTSFGINRLKTQCEWYSTVGFAPYTQKLVQRTQQRYSTERKYKLVGDVSLLAPNFGNITPEQIAGFYDYEPVDGTLPVDRFAQATLWNQIMQQIATQPQIIAQYDIAKIFSWVANLAGIKNMAQFKLQAPGQLQQQAQAGNVVPIGEALKNIPTQLPNVGPNR